MNLNYHKITNIADPRSGNKDAMSYKYFEGHFFKSLYNDINADGKRIFNIGSNANRDQVINRAYVENFYYKNDGSYSLSENMNGNNNKITSLSDETSHKDAINKQQLTNTLSNYLKRDGTNKLSANLTLSDGSQSDLTWNGQVRFLLRNVCTGGSVFSHKYWNL